MKRYVVIFEDSAQADVRKSYDWGCRAWGKREAQQWAANCGLRLSNSEA